MSPAEHPVKTARLARGWRLVDLAEKVGRSAPLISMVENYYRPKPSTRQLIADALELPVEQLFPEAT